MVQTLKIKRSSVNNSLASLLFGELALGDNNGELVFYIGNNANSPIVINKNRITRLSSAISLVLTKVQGILPGAEITMSVAGNSVTLPTVGSSDDGLSIKLGCSYSSKPFSVLPSSGITIDGDSSLFLYNDEYIQLEYNHASLTWRIIV
jgi:hypothetical protein